MFLRVVGSVALTTERVRKRPRVGCLGGSLLALLACAALAVGFVVYHRSADAPPRPLHLTSSQLPGTWAAPGGGVLVIRGDGTFTATNVCGFGNGGSSPGSDTGKWKPGGGQWLSITTGTKTGGVDFFGGHDQSELDEGGSADSRVLWRYNGVPEESDSYCELHRR